MTISIDPPARIKPLRTRYNGVTYRSRLEAKWACLFDLLKWPHDYEPVDLRFYIPDFAIRFPAGTIAVEVKPEFSLDALIPHARKIIESGWTGEALALGACLFPNTDIGQHIEWVGVDDEGLRQFDNGPANVFRCIDCGGVSLRNGDNSWRCRVNGCYDGNAHVSDFDPNELDRLWKEAGDRVQWMPHA